MTQNTPVKTTLPELSITLKCLFSSYLLVMGMGALLATAQILMTHGLADGKAGLSFDDIVYSYQGDPKHSKIETKLNGSMRDKASSADKLAIIKWVRHGAPKQQWDENIKDIFYKNCISCHSVIPGLPNFTRYDNVKKVAQSESGASFTMLTRVSHIHIFSISFIFLFNGIIFSYAIGIKEWQKALLVSLPFLFLSVDVFSWWLTKIHADFAWVTIISGVGYYLCWVITWLISMYQMWVLPYKKHKLNQLSQISTES